MAFRRASPRLALPAARVTRDERREAIAVFAFGFFTFMPYPAAPIGSNSALQIGNMLTLLMLILPARRIRWSRQPFLIYALLTVPLLLSWFRIALAQSEDAAQCSRSSVMVMVSLLSMIVVQLYAPRHALRLMTGIACAVVIHTAVGFWQLYDFSIGQFPMVWLYVNASLSGVQTNTDEIVKYVQRPFGIFSESSAMASCLSPWIVLWFAQMCGLVRFRQQPAAWQRRLFALATFSGLLLIVLSRSGHVVITLAAMGCCALVWLKNCRATPRNYLILLLSAGVILPLVAWLTVNSMNDRIGHEAMGNSSWEERSSSLAIGFDILVQRDFWTQCFGIGEDLLSNAIWEQSRIAAVYSVLLSHLYCTGLIGAIGVCWVGAYLLKIWRACQFNGALVAMLIVWLFGITLTTSFTQLLPLWVTLGWLSIWPTVCAPPLPRSAAPAAQRPGRSPVLEHRSLWHEEVPG